jgi:uncharacterized membrane protein
MNLLESNPIIDKFTNKYWTIVFILIVILNFIIRFSGVIDESIYGDEAFSIFFAQQSPAELFNRLLIDRNPPLYFFILHFWIKWFGLNAIFLKGLSILFSTATTVFLLLIGQRHIGKSAGIIASVIYLFSMIWMVEGREIRAFALEGMLAVLSFYLYLNVVKKNKISSAVGLTIVNILLLLSHYIAIYIPLVQLICSFIFLQSNRKGFKMYLISQIAAAIIYSPWIGIVIANIPEKGTFWLETPGLREIWYTFVSLSGNITALIIHWVVILCFTILIFLKRKNDILSAGFDYKIYILFLAWYLIPIAAGFSLAQIVPIFRMKYVVYANLGLLLLMGYILASLRYHFSIVLILVSIVIYLQLRTYKISPNVDEDWKSVVENIKAEKDDNTTVVITAWYKFRDFTYYYNRDYFKDYNNTHEYLFSEKVIATNDTIGLYQQKYDSTDKLLFIRSHDKIADPDGLVRNQIRQKFTMCSHFTGGNILVERYIKKHIPCSEYNIVFNREGRNCANWQKREEKDDKTGKKIIYYINNLEYDPYCDIPINADTLNRNSGKYGIKIDSKMEFGPLFTIHPKKLQSVQKIEIEFFIKFLERNGARLVISNFKEGVDLFRQEYSIGQSINSLNDWNLITNQLIVPEKIDTSGEFRIYFWNPSEPTVYLDDIEIRLFQDSESE